MKDEIDNRSIEIIPFAQDFTDPIAREEALLRIRQMFIEAGTLTAQAIIEHGCTGLVGRLTPKDPRTPFVPARAPLVRVAFAREHMAGAGFGIPCYVPPDRFCLVHNTIGGLQDRQVARHSEFLNLVSRELTPEEAKHAAAVGALIKQTGAKEAKKRFGAEEAKDDPVEERPEPSASRLTASFTCPEHKTIVYRCRYCLAAAIITGPFEPELFLEAQNESSSNILDIEKLDEMLASFKGEELRVFARVKRWTRKLVETTE